MVGCFGNGFLSVAKTVQTGTYLPTYLCRYSLVFKLDFVLDIGCSYVVFLLLIGANSGGHIFPVGRFLKKNVRPCVSCGFSGVTVQFSFAGIVKINLYEIRPAYLQ